MGVKSRATSKLEAIHAKTPSQFEQWEDYATALAIGVGLTIIVGVLLAPLYVFATLGEQLGANGIYFGIGSYAMFLLYIGSRWF